MLRVLSRTVVRFPAATLLIIAGISVFLAAQLGDLRWETDARVYLPKGHPAIIYDEKIDETFGVKDALIIGIVNEEKGVFNTETLARIARITDQVAALPGVIASRSLDVASLATATAFVGNEERMGAMRIMETVPTDPAQIAEIKSRVYENADLFVGNIVSEDGTAAMIRAKLKEGATNRYSTYFAIRSIIAAEQGARDWEGGWSGGQWGGQSSEQWWSKENGADAARPADAGAGADFVYAGENGDVFYLAGRPVIEVTSGLDAIKDMQFMIPMLVLAMLAVLALVFHTARGVIIPILATTGAIIWTLGLMAWLGVPMFTISTMLPVILVAVGIGDSVHLMSHYYDVVLKDPYRSGGDIVTDVMDHLGAPLVTTSVTTAIGFLSLLFADMPPFKIFGLFTVVGIVFSWLLSVTFVPALLTLLKPKVGRYLAKRRSMRVRTEQSRLTQWLVGLGGAVARRRTVTAAGVVILVGVFAFGASRLYVDSSWMSDFREDSEVAQSNRVLNTKFDGTLFLHVVVEADEPGGLKSPLVLKKIQALQDHIEKQPLVGDSLSVVDFLTSMNKTLHAGDPAYERLPETEAQIGEYLFLYSVSGQPELLDEVIDYDYKVANVTISIQTDHTRELKAIIDDVNRFVADEFVGVPVDVNLAGSANNSYVWAQLLIDSQATAIVFSKVGIFLIAALLFRSLSLGFMTIIPVTFSTLVIAGMAGFLEIPLDVSTALAAGVAIGVGVDYAVHYLFRYRRERKDGLDHLGATVATMRTVGRTIVFNALIVAVGFLVLFFSQFPPHVKLGNFVAAYMVVSCFSALLLLPLVLNYKRGA